MNSMTVSHDRCRDRRPGGAFVDRAFVGPAEDGAGSAARACGSASSRGGAAGRSRLRPFRLPRRRRPQRRCRVPGGRSHRGAGRARQAAESRRCGTPRIVAVVDVQVGGRAGQGGHDRSRLCLAADLDHLHRQDDRDDGRSAQAAQCARARSATPARWRKRNSRSAPRATSCRRCSRPRCAKRACRRASRATPASRSARPRALPKSCAPRRGGSGSAWACSPPSARRRPSSDCSARSGAS